MSTDNCVYIFWSVRERERERERDIEHQVEFYERTSFLLSILINYDGQLKKPMSFFSARKEQLIQWKSSVL